MIPLRDTIPSSRAPIVNYALIAANVLVFVHELSLGADAEGFIFRWGLIPSDFAWPNLLTSMFIHGGLGHLIGNMLYLYIFGDNVEDRLGRGRYLAFYLLCGIAAGTAQALISADSKVPMVGASGAIAGVAGAYLLFFPRARVVTVIPILLFWHMTEVPAIVFLVIWFLWQVMSGVATLGHDATGGVAFFAHVGGFVAGMIFGPVLRTRQQPVPRWV